jgi:hypothetical protein
MRSFGICWILLSIAAAPAPAAPLAGDEDWLCAAVADELRQAGEHGWEALAKRIDQITLARLACGRLDRVAALVDLEYARRACRYLPLAAKADTTGKLAGWLLEHRDVSRLLFRAMADVEKPADAMARFEQLWRAGSGKVAKFADLAVAFATAGELRHYRRQDKPATLVQSFDYYTGPGAAFRCEVGKLPYELARYLADTRASLADRKWAQATYGAAKDIDAAFFQIEYDMDYYRDGKPRKIESVPYTLSNLARVGGVCIDQAYFASEICKALGIPAAIVLGRGGTGVEHAWFARFVPDAKGGQWLSRTGRYQEHLYYVGVLRDPGGGEMILDSELMLLGSSMRLPLARREEADAAAALAGFVDAVRDSAPPADVSLLAPLAEAGGKPVGGHKAPAAPRPAWIRAARKIDLALAEDLLDLSIQRDLAHGRAWRMLVELRKAGRIPVDHMSRFFSVLTEKTAAQNPEYSCQMVLQIVPTMPDAGARERSWRRAMEVYGQRPDLRGRLMIALGDDWRRAGQKDKALAAYRDAATQTAHLAEVVVLAAGRAEQLLLDGGRRDLAIQLYSHLFAKTEPMQVNEVFRAQTSHYQLGSRLAELLRQDGKQTAASDIRKRING